MDFSRNLLDTYINFLAVFKVVWKRKWVVIIASCLLASLGAVNAYLAKPTYSASATLSVEGSKRGSTLMSIAAQFGVGKTGGISGEKIASLFSKDAIIYDVLLTEVTIDDTTDYIANHFISKVLYDRKGLEKIRFTHDNLEAHDYSHRSALRSIAGQLTRQYMAVNIKEDEGMIDLNVILEDMDLAYHVNQQLVKRVERFFKETSQTRSRSSIDVMENKMDSVLNEIRIVENNYTAWKDNNRNLIKSSALIEEVRFKRDLEVLNKLYVQAFQNLEMTKVNLEFDQEVFQLVNYPIYPLNSSKSSFIVKGILFGIIGFILSTIFIVVHFFISQINKKAQDTNLMD